ncbi:hypothetical protein MIB92_06730 [Aestuariirhabdus sp. Z084]|uniref:hypothetical protein n=1 Tax=Aestuariirhabdus haliotis TaxID=2918751 RepID=UPI00201B4438|nr:hypothetical protein [Aestuariirhabdus haliotis]MCL6415339.1 hypothetical protein [Aestuariirhabdus haliotis]MCL6419095.1 hypothetical protein [Aestuariirhabdus haliotis]
MSDQPTDPELNKSDIPADGTTTNGVDEPTSVKRTVREELNTPAHQRIEEEFEEACARLSELDYELLGMTNMPSESDLEDARHYRSIWHSALMAVSALLILCILDYLPAWLGGITSALLFALAVGYFDGLIPIIPGGNRYVHLLRQRQRYHLRLRDYVRQLEGSYGYIHTLQPLQQLNPNLEKHYFNKLCSLSRKGLLAQQISSLENLRLYYQFLIEAGNANQIREQLKLKEQMEQEAQNMAPPEAEPVPTAENMAEPTDDSATSP